MCADEDIDIGTEELHGGYRGDGGQGSKHGPLVSKLVDQHTGEEQTNDLSYFGDLLEDCLSPGTEASDNHLEHEIRQNSLDVVLSRRQLLAIFLGKFGKTKELTHQRVIISVERV